MQKLAKPLKQLTQYSILKQVPGEEERYRFSIDLYRRYFRTFVTPNYSYEKSSDERFFIKEESTRVSSAVDFYTDEEF